MNELALLREHGPEAPEATDAVLRTAREQLLSGMLEAPARTRHIPRWTMGAAAVVAVVAAIGTSLVLGSDGTHGTSAAAAVLNRAARNTLSLPTARSGQYYYERTLLTSSGGEPCPDLGGDSQFVNVFQPQTVEEWSPADGTEVGRIRVRPGRPYYASAQDEANARAHCPDVLAKYVPNGSDRSGLPSELREHGTGPFQNYDPASLAKWPRDPHKLVQLMLATGGGSGSSAEALVNASDLLGGGPAVPADLRHALFQAIALIPGVTVDQNASSSGRPAVAVSVTDNQSRRQELLIDSGSGLVLGDRDVLTGSGQLIYEVANYFGIASSLTEVPPTL